jgi:hypothetical protein
MSFNFTESSRDQHAYHVKKNALKYKGEKFLSDFKEDLIKYYDTHLQYDRNQKGTSFISSGLNSATLNPATPERDREKRALLRQVRGDINAFVRDLKCESQLDEKIIIETLSDRCRGGCSGDFDLSNPFKDVNVIGNIEKCLKAAICDLGETLGDGTACIGGIFKVLGSIFTGLTEVACAFIVGILNGLIVLKYAVLEICNGFAAVISKMGDWFDQIYQFLSDPIGSITRTLQSFFNLFLDMINPKKWLQKITAFFGGILSIIVVIIVVINLIIMIELFPIKPESSYKRDKENMASLVVLRESVKKEIREEMKLDPSVPIPLNL